MAEPARKHKEIEPDIRPHFGVVEGGGQSTPDRANLRGLERQESKPEKPNTGSIAEQEASGSNVIKGPWKDNTTGSSKNNLKSSGFMVSVKKKSASAAIALTLIGLAFVGVGGVAGPSLLLVNIKEVMVNKFDSQLTSMTSRTSSLLANKISTQATTGLCGTVMSIACKYSTMSEKMLANFDEAGIKVNYDKTTFLGRAKPTSFEFNGETIEAANLKSKIASDPEFGAALDKAYNPKFAGFKDTVWNWVAGKLGISEKPATLDGDTDAEKLASVQNDTKTPTITDEAPTANVGEADPNGGTYDQPAADLANQQAAAANDIIDGASDVAQNGETLGSEIAVEAESATIDAAGESTGSAVGSATNSAINLVKVTGVADAACTIYGTTQAVGYAAKTVRAFQLARYAMIFLNVADQIKAGVAKSEDVAYLGGVLTAEVGAAKLTATDSFGYKYAAYGDRGKMSTMASRFLAGGGFTGTLINLTTMLNNILGGKPRQVCGILKNPVIGIGSFVAGVGSFLYPPLRVTLTAVQIRNIALIAALNIAAMFLPAMLKDVIAGVLVDKTTVGEAAGDALTSGASGIMGSAAKAGGNAPLTPQQAVAYNNLTKTVIAQNAAKDRLTHSPLDPTNSNTFIGSFIAQIIPYASKMSSLSGMMTSIASLTTSSLTQITSPNTKATSEDDYTQCQDEDYRTLGLATDPYCNVTYGIPPEALSADPITVAKTLINDGQIDPLSGSPKPGSAYEKFTADCIDRTRPLGDTGPNNTELDGSECLFNNTNKNFYIYYIDQRVQTGMDEEVQTNNSTPAGGSSIGDSEQPADTKAINKGWTLKNSVDYSGVQCAEGSTDKGTYTHPTKHFTIRLCDTKLGEVSSLISQRVVNMVNAAKKDGVNLAGSSWRSYEAQQQLRADNCNRGHCNPPTANPGNSQHERGIGTDFGAADKGGEVWNWLEANGSKYGYHNLPSENWHWSMSGG
jgi:hypothetical protein